MSKIREIWPEIPLFTREVDDQVEKLQVKNAESFVEWIPNNVKSGVVLVSIFFLLLDQVLKFLLEILLRVSI